METADNYTEQQALDLVAELSRKHGWKSTIFTTEDIAQIWLDLTERVITPEEMAQVKETRMWAKYLDEAMCREGSEYLYETIHNIIGKKGL